MFSKQFWRDATERALKTAAQAGILALGAGQINVIGLDVMNIAGFMVGGAVLSYLTSIVSTNFGTPGTPSLVGEPE
jgi:hypothetical protein